MFADMWMERACLNMWSMSHKVNMCVGPLLQGMMFAEMWMERVATSLSLSPAQVRALNLYHEGDTTHFGQVMENCHVRACWDKAMANADYSARAGGLA